MKNILVISEYFEDGASRYAGIAAEIRRCFPGCRLFGLLFLPGRSRDREVEVPPFDDASLFRSAPALPWRFSHPGKGRSPSSIPGCRCHG